MKKIRPNLGLRWNGACVVALWMSASCAWGGLLPPLYVGNLEPVKDQYGRSMLGSHLPSGAANRSRVELRVTTNGIVRPPSTNGAAHPYHPLVNANGVGGMGMNSGARNSGTFCMVLPTRPPTNIMIFARVFNAPTLAESSFYADSKPVAARSNEASRVFVFGPAKPLDPGDADGDGLNNSWEKALGIDDRLTADYDGDGMRDLDEMLAGTAPDDPGSLLNFRLIRRETAASAPAMAGGSRSKPIRVRWQSVPGKQYLLEYVPMLTHTEGAPPLFVPVGDVVIAEAGEFEIDMLVNVPEDTLTGTFRVRLVTKEAN